MLRFGALFYAGVHLDVFLKLFFSALLRCCVLQTYTEDYNNVRMVQCTCCGVCLLFTRMVQCTCCGVCL